MTRTIKVERKISPAAKMVVEDFNRRYGDARNLLSQDVCEALVDQMVLGICLGQSSSLEWKNVRAHTQQIRGEVMWKLGFWDHEQRDHYLVRSAAEAAKGE